MNCQQAEKYFAAIVDGEIVDWWKRRSFLSHLDACLVCQSMLKLQRKIKRLILTQYQTEKAPNYLKAKIRKNLFDA